MFHLMSTHVCACDLVAQCSWIKPLRKRANGSSPCTSGLFVLDVGSGPVRGTSALREVSREVSRWRLMFDSVSVARMAQELEHDEVV